MTDWNDNAKAAVREFADYIGQSDKCERYLEAFEKKKTLADAYEACNKLWPNNHNKLYYDPRTGCWFCHDEPQDWYIFVCTRAEFEDYVKEQEGEKWTHRYKDFLCKISLSEPDGYGSIIILNENNVYIRCYPEDLKPIKPTITKEQHEFLCKFSADSNNLEVIAEVESYLAKHDII